MKQTCPIEILGERKRKLSLNRQGTNRRDMKPPLEFSGQLRLERRETKDKERKTGSLTRISKIDLILFVSTPVVVASYLLKLVKKPGNIVVLT